MFTLDIEGEVRSLLLKKTFSGDDVSTWTVDKKKKILRSIMNIVAKYHPFNGVIMLTGAWHVVHMRHKVNERLRHFYNSNWSQQYLFMPF